MGREAERITNPRPVMAAANRYSAHLTPEDRIGLLRDMLRIRAFEDEVYRALLAGLVPGTTHLCQGHEAVSVGVAKALRPDDYIACTYRGHGHCIARGMDPVAGFAELFGRAAGCCGGLGGSMHLMDKRLGLIGAFSIVGAGLPFATGAAMAAQMDGRGQLAVAFFGDGAANIGAFHEALNLASVWKLPVLFVCENNLYGEYSRIDRTTPFEDIARRADAYAMPGAQVDGNDVLAVYDTAAEAAARARSGGGPTLIECKTYRQGGHSRTDPAKYRPKEEVEAWLKRDPIALFIRALVKEGTLAEDAAERLRTEIRDAMRADSKRAAELPHPAYDPAALAAATYAP